MSTYLYDLPTTGAIAFADFCDDPTRSYTTAIAEATQARANLRAALKESKRTDGERDFLKLVKVLMVCVAPCAWMLMYGKVVDDYLPHLYGIIAACDADELHLSSEPSESGFRSMHAEKRMVDIAQYQALPLRILSALHDCHYCLAYDARRSCCFPKSVHVWSQLACRLRDGARCTWKLWATGALMRVSRTSACKLHPTLLAAMLQRDRARGSAERPPPNIAFGTGAGSATPASS